MKKFEYKVCIHDITWEGKSVKSVDIDKLNEYGKKGWEAVGVLENERILLKREIQ